MGLKNTKDTFGSVAKSFHWLSAFLVISLLFLGFFMGDIPKSTAWHKIAKNWHQLLGLFLLILVVLRSLWSLINIKPQSVGKPSKLELFLIKLTHTILYIFMFIIPVSGWIMSSAKGKLVKLPTLAGYHFAMPGIPLDINLAKLAHQLHEIFAWILVVLITLHVLAALKHHFIDKDNILKRILPNFNKL